MSATSETLPITAPAPTPHAMRPPSVVSRIRLILAVLATLTLLPYAWGRTLVVYSQWRQVERQFPLQVAIGLAIVILLNFHLAAKFRSQKFARNVLLAVLVLWTAVEVAMIGVYNGDAAPGWLVFAGFYPATLWIVWAAWMFFMPMRWSVRLGVLAVLIAAVFPFVELFEVSGLTGDTRVNFALINRVKPDSLVKSNVGELAGGGFKLVANPKTDFPAFQGPGRTAVLSNVKLDPNWAEHPPREVLACRSGPAGAASWLSAVMPSRRSSAAMTSASSAAASPRGRKCGCTPTRPRTRGSPATRGWAARARAPPDGRRRPRVCGRGDGDFQLP